MVLVELLVIEFQIQEPCDDIAKRVIGVFIFGIIKLSLSCLVSYLFYVLKLSPKIFWNGLIVYTKHDI